MLHRCAATVATFATLGTLAACTDEHVGQQSGEATAAFNVRESVEQLHVTRAEPGHELGVLDEAGREVARQVADDLGSVVFRTLEPGEGYRVVDLDNDESSRALRVWGVDESLPEREFYESQQLVPGYQYITMRDGTTLSAYVTLPGPIEEGPYPTIVNYSGYSPAKPGEPIGLDLPVSCDVIPTLCDTPNHPSGLLAGLMGYATVGVNMRGTGCSGGAYDYFETLQLLDGYDIIEVVAAQSWVKHNHVGMAGLSFPGISQLFVARVQPPSLAAITPLSVIADTASSTLAPGGIFNDGFALSWAQGVLDGAQPYGKGWEQELVDAGDEVCEENQLLHGQAVDTVQKALENPFRSAELNDPIDPSLFVDEITVPVFMTGAWQDEQTGGHFPVLFDRFESAPVTKFTAFNGEHADGYTPHIISEWKTFLDLYVSQEIPQIDPFLRTAAPVFFKELFGASLELGPDRFADYASYEEAKAAYEAEDDLRIIFEVGEKPGGTENAPEGSFEERFSQWPIAGTEPLRFYLTEAGGLSETPTDAGGDSGSSFEVNPEVARLTSADGWQAPKQGEALAFQTEPLEADLVLLGHASADLWVQSTADDADLEVNVIEVRPDGQEVYVQSGWLRATHRALAPDATELRPKKTHLERDSAPLPAGSWELLRIEIFPFGHVFRAGSRLRITVETPGGNRTRWTFILKDLGDDVVHSVAHSADHPSSIVFSHLPSVVAPANTPGCGLRAQPCRDEVTLVNPPFAP